MIEVTWGVAVRLLAFMFGLRRRNRRWRTVCACGYAKRYTERPRVDDLTCPYCYRVVTAERVR